MSEKIKLQYVQTGQLLDERFYGMLNKGCAVARVRSERWCWFLAPGPCLAAHWINDMFDWLVKEYPEEFELIGE